MSGCKINISDIFQNKLSNLSLSLAKVNGDMNTTAKSDMLDNLNDNVEIWFPVLISLERLVY